VQKGRFLSAKKLIQSFAPQKIIYSKASKKVAADLLKDEYINFSIARTGSFKRDFHL